MLNKALQLTANPLRGLSAAELGPYARMEEGSALEMRRFSLNSLSIMNSFPRDLLYLSNFKG